MWVVDRLDADPNGMMGNAMTGSGSLSWCIKQANADADAKNAITNEGITFAQGLPLDPITNDATITVQQAYNLADPLDNLSITGNIPVWVQLDNTQAYQADTSVFEVGVNCTVMLQTLTIAFGRANVSGGGGGGAVVNEGLLTLAGCQLKYDYGTFGGAVWNRPNAVLTVQGCTFFQNSANWVNEPGGSTTGSGGAIFSEGNLSVQTSTFDSNSASSDGGAIAVSCFTNPSVSFNTCKFLSNLALASVGANGQGDGNGGALFLRTIGGGKSVVMQQCTFKGNEAQNNGGGIYLVGGGVLDMVTMADYSGNVDHINSQQESNLIYAVTDGSSIIDRTGAIQPGDIQDGPP